ncbi:MAG TPA: CDP-glucose 4,6-dehydratase [Pirellulales bacterium]|nr:CDP-glucose 4,6-dehydratase [Pirellulales bacterium]
MTGHTGFKGAWLATWLKTLGANVSGFALAPESGRPCLFEAARVDRDMKSTFGDVRDAPAMAAALAAQQPEIVFHLAAQPVVRRSYASPVETLHVNALGTAHLLEAVRQTPSVRAVVIVTSDKCYENREWPWGYREDEPLGGRDPYSCSKACAELIAAAYRQSYFSAPHAPKLATVRAGNVFGGGDWSEDRLVPDILRAQLDGRQIVLRNPHAVRPWQHVLEPLHGYLLLGERLCVVGEAFCGAWNFGPGDDDMVSVQELTERLVKHWGGGHEDSLWGGLPRPSASADGPGRPPHGRETRPAPSSETVRCSPANAPHEAHTLRLDSSKARQRLGWRPLLSLDEGLQWTVAWTRAWAQAADAGETVLKQQIENYQERSFAVRRAA